MYRKANEGGQDGNGDKIRFNENMAKKRDARSGVMQRKNGSFAIVTCDS